MDFLNKHYSTVSEAREVTMESDVRPFIRPFVRSFVRSCLRSLTLPPGLTLSIDYESFLIVYRVIAVLDVAFSSRSFGRPFVRRRLLVAVVVVVVNHVTD